MRTRLPAQLELSMFGFDMLETVRLAIETTSLSEQAHEELLEASTDIFNCSSKLFWARERLGKDGYEKLLAVVLELIKSSFVIGSKGVVPDSAKASCSKLQAGIARRGKTSAVRDATIAAILLKHRFDNLIEQPTKLAGIISLELESARPPVKLKPRAIMRRMQKDGLNTPQSTRGRPRKNP